ncbi:serine/threonine-protein kinase [Ideonella sp.]|uniref:serine/threonine-protein kinase n=1 Tax=Ideonella sp. TaxID=1929293 RepID=UPI003BB6D127
MPTDAAPTWNLIKTLFDQALAMPADQRADWLAGLSLDPASRAELQSLLSHYDEATGGASFMAESAASSLTGSAAQIGQRLGAWVIVAPLGAGGMGEVFAAQRADGQFEGRAAIKLLKRGMDSALVLQRFAQERQALARLNHPNIASLLDAGLSEQGLPYFVMEFIDGVPIDEAVVGMTLEQKLGLFLQLADAVAHAHRSLLVHRDLKPGNVLVTPSGQVKLLDFGIAKALDPQDSDVGASADLTLGPARAYTPNYASPEQVRGEPVTTATDLYSLGVLLYQLLTGVRPTGRHATTPAEAARSVLNDAPTRPSRLTPDQVPDPDWLRTRQRLQGDLDRVLLKALEKPIALRYASADALMADIRALLGGYPVSARPASAGYLARRFIGRNKVAVATSVLGAVGVLAGLGVSIWQAREALAARDDAQRQLAGVKNITTELVFRFGDAISQLPGGAATQETMLKQTVASLDLTLKNAPDDPDLLVLVSSALGRLAQIQGNPTFAGQNREAEAEATVSRALALADQAWARKHGEWRFASQHLITLLTRATLLRGQGKPAEGLKVLELAIARSADTLAEPLSDEARASIQELRANVWTNMAHFNDHVGRPSLGKPREALKYYDQAEAEFRSLYDNPALMAELTRATEPGTPPPKEWANHNIANVHAGRALVYQRLDDAPAMRREIEAALLLRADNLQRNPGNAVWRQSEMFDRNTLAIALLRLGENDAALTAAQLSWDIAGQRLKEEGPQSAWSQTRSTLAPQYGRALTAAGRHAEALPVYDLALDRLAAMARKDPNPAVRNKLAWMQVHRARSMVALGQREPARLLLEPAVADLATLLEVPAQRREALTTRAQGLALLASLAPAAGQTAAAAQRAQALADLQAAAAVSPLMPEQLALQTTLQAALPPAAAQAASGPKQP